jgi:hypothetical protein
LPPLPRITRAEQVIVGSCNFSQWPCFLYALKLKPDMQWRNGGRSKPIYFELYFICQAFLLPSLG